MHTNLHVQSNFSLLLYLYIITNLTCPRQVIENVLPVQTLQYGIVTSVVAISTKILSKYDVAHTNIKVRGEG